jgi:hypothetical protein
MGNGGSEETVKYRIFWCIWMLSLLAMSVGCATMQPPLDPKIYYKHDMVMNIDGTDYLGVAVAPRSDHHKIVITSQEDMDLLQISSCAEDFDISNAIKNSGIGGWLFPKRSFTFNYSPNAVERQPGCLLKIQGLNKAEGRHSWAFIQWMDPKFNLPAIVSCNNAADFKTNGTTICQNLQHLIMRISFDTPVLLSSKVLDRCKLPDAATTDSLHWQFQVANRECIYEFMEQKEPFRRHVLTTVGYEAVPIRLDE